MAGRGGILLCEISSDLVSSVLRLHATSLLHVKNKLFCQPFSQTPLFGSPPCNGTLVGQGVWKWEVLRAFYSQIKELTRWSLSKKFRV